MIVKTVLVHFLIMRRLHPCGCTIRQLYDFSSVLVMRLFYMLSFYANKGFSLRRTSLAPKLWSDHNHLPRFPTLLNVATCIILIFFTERRPNVRTTVI